MQKNINVCCTQYKDGDCLHPAVPRGIFDGNAGCVHVYPIRHKDPRIGIINVCKIRVPFERPNPPPMPPKAP